jgi:hypothetical protein
MRILLLCCLMGVLLFACRHERPDAPVVNPAAGEWAPPSDSKSLYFPLSHHPHDTAIHEQTLDTSTDRFYSLVLFSLRAPILSRYSGPSEVYRFTMIPALFNHPISIAISRESDGYRLDINAVCKAQYSDQYRDGR